jgi:hypothetical protein
VRHSVFAKPLPSKATIEPMRKQIKEPVYGRGFIYALIGISILVLLGGGTHVLAQGFALLLAGWFF